MDVGSAEGAHLLRAVRHFWMCDTVCAGPAHANRGSSEGISLMPMYNTLASAIYLHFCDSSLTLQWRANRGGGGGMTKSGPAMA